MSYNEFLRILIHSVLRTKAVRCTSAKKKKKSEEKQDARATSRNARLREGAKCVREDAKYIRRHRFFKYRKHLFKLLRVESGRARERSGGMFRACTGDTLPVTVPVFVAARQQTLGGLLETASRTKTANVCTATAVCKRVVVLVVHHQGCRRLTGFPTVLVAGGVTLAAVRFARLARCLLSTHSQLHTIATSVRRRWHSWRYVPADAMHK